MKTILKNPAKGRQNYVSPDLEVIDLQLEASVCVVASGNGDIDDVYEDPWGTI